jgi:hypothetical protein
VADPEDAASIDAPDFPSSLAQLGGGGGRTFHVAPDGRFLMIKEARVTPAPFEGQN